MQSCGLDVRANESSLRVGECRASYSPSKIWCGRRDLNPHGPFKPCGFSCRLRLSPPERDALGGLTPSLRSGLSLHHPPEAPELRCCPSSLYTFPAGVSTRLGSGLPFQVSPNLSSSASPVSRRALKFSLSPLRMPFRHARAVVLFSVVYHRARSGNLHISFSFVRHTSRILFAVFGWFCFFFGFGLMMLIATASSYVLICAA